MAKDILIAVRVDPLTHKAVQQLADDDKRSISAYVRIVLEEHLKTHRPKNRIRA